MNLKNNIRTLIWIILVPAMIQVIAAIKILLYIMAHGTGSGLGSYADRFEKYLIINYLPLILPLVGLNLWYFFWTKKQKKSWFLHTCIIIGTIVIYFVMKYFDWIWR
jgi:hypothetical protein